MIKVIVTAGPVRKADLFPENMTAREAISEFAPEYINSIHAINGSLRPAENLDLPLRKLAENDIVCLDSPIIIIHAAGDEPDTGCDSAFGGAGSCPEEPKEDDDSECPF